jgi:hypothetical protein
MNAHRSPLGSAAALIESGAHLMGRVNHIALYATPNQRLRLMSEFALVEMLLDPMEYSIVSAAQAVLKAMPKQRALPPGRRATPQRTS